MSHDGPKKKLKHVAYIENTLLCLKASDYLWKIKTFPWAGADRQ